MSSRRLLDAQFDFFVPAVVDLKWRDQQDTMERPFFSLSKNKRVKPIEYKSPRDGVFVNVNPHQKYGMATIWDADILIWAASVICDLQNKKINDIPKKIHFQPYDLLKAIGRGTSGAQYVRLREGLERLKSTDIQTNIRAPRGKKETHFSWVSEWTDVVDTETGESRGMTLTLSDWFYDGIMREGGVLAIDPAYFHITGGRERWLYRVARKHAGGAGGEGFAIGLKTLHEKSGAEGTFRRFKFEITKIVHRNDLPGYSLFIEEVEGREPKLRMVRRDMVTEEQQAARAARAVKKKVAKSEQPPPLPLLLQQLTDETIANVRRDFPGWDPYAMKADFDAWLADNPSKTPTNYNAAFYGFMKQHHTKNRHRLS